MKTTNLALLPDHAKVVQLNANGGTLRAVLDSLPGNCALLDNSGKIVFVNRAWKAFAKANGLKHPDHCIGQNYLSTCRKASSDDPLARMAYDGVSDVLLGLCQTFSMEYPCHSPDEKRWFMLSVTHLADSLDPAVLVMHTNITARVLSELETKAQHDQLRAVVEKRREYEQRLDEFYSVVAHDIRSPLCSVQGALAIVRQLRRSNLDPRDLEMLTAADKSAQEVISLVSDFLDNKKIEENKFEFKMQDASARVLLEEASALLFGLAAAANVTVKIHCGHDYSTHCDPRAIVRVLTNLLSNAIKVTPPQGTVVLSCNPLGDRLRFAVIDEGPGIPPEFKSRLFDRFSISSQKTSGMPSSGLGLSIVKAFLAEHNSEPIVESEIDHGTTIAFDLPRSN